MMKFAHPLPFPKGPTGKPARINLAKRLELGCMAADGTTPTGWVEEKRTSSADDTDNNSITARPLDNEASHAARLDKGDGIGYFNFTVARRNPTLSLLENRKFH